MRKDKPFLRCKPIEGQVNVKPSGIKAGAYDVAGSALPGNFSGIGKAESSAAEKSQNRET